MPKKVILDMDPGIDDALAILLAVKSPELKVEAITTVSGNVHVDKASLNALKILELAKVEDIPVARGMERPLIRELETAEHIHGENGLGNTNLPIRKLALHPKHAVDLLIEKITSAPKEITLITTGPLTNVAMAILKEPKIVGRIKEVVLMGGAYAITPYGYGNVTSVAEFNVWCDPEAAKIVFRSGLPIVAVGLDITTDPSTCLREEHLKKFSCAGTAISKFIVQASRFYLTRTQRDRMELHDPVAVAVAIDKTLVTTKKFFVDVETKGEITRGQTIADRRPWSKMETNIEVCYRIDGKRFLSLFMERLLEK